MDSRNRSMWLIAMFLSLNFLQSRVRQPTLTILGLRRLWQAYHKFRASLGYTMNLRPNKLSNRI